MERLPFLGRELPRITAPFIDSHCHVTPRAFGDEVDATLARGRSVGVRAFVIIGAGYGEAGNEQALDVAARHEDCFASVGVHPHDAAAADDALLHRIEGWIDRGEACAMGEIGLDYHYDRSPRDDQQRVFRRCLDIARATGAPSILHCREAEDDTLRQLDESKAWDGNVLIHCFSHSEPFAHAVLERGGFLSIPGIVTFKNAQSLRAVAAWAPLDRLLVETDAPYLAPVPFRGARNEPALVAAVVEQVATLRGADANAVADATARNTVAFFGLPPSVLTQAVQ